MEIDGCDLIVQESRSNWGFLNISNDNFDASISISVLTILLVLALIGAHVILVDIGF